MFSSIDRHKEPLGHKAWDTGFPMEIYFIDSPEMMYKEAEEYYSMFHPQEDVVLVVLDDNDDSSSPLTPAKEETDEEIHLVFGA